MFGDPLRVLVCGGRFYSDKKRIFFVLDKLNEEKGIELVIHGCASGADSLAGEWAKERGIVVLEFPAQWGKYGNSAGKKRNLQMLKEGKPDLLIAFPGGTGTANMIMQSAQYGIRIVKIKSTPELLGRKS